MEKCIHLMLQLPSSLCSHLEIRHYFDEPFVYSSHLFAVRVLPGDL